jgi:hypothetical protein
MEAVVIAKIRALLHPVARRQTARVERFLQIEQNDYCGTIERRRRALEEETERITKEHHQRFAGGVQGPGLLESALLPVRLDYLRTLITDHIEIRKRLAQECPDVLSQERLDKLEEEMVRTVDNFRLARDDDFKRRVAASGMPSARSLYREDAEYGDVVALIRREVQQLRLNHQLGRGKPGRFTRDQKIAIVAVGAAIVVGIITAILTLTVPEVRRFIGLDKQATQSQPAKTDPSGKK